MIHQSVSRCNTNNVDQKTRKSRFFSFAKGRQSCGARSDAAQNSFRRAREIRQAHDKSTNHTRENAPDVNYEVPRRMSG